MRNRRSAARKAAAAWPKAAPSSSVSAKGAMMPSRLTKRLATLVAMISFFRRWARIASPCRSRIAAGKAGSSSGTSVGSSVNFAISIAACSRILEVESRTASSGRVRPEILLAAAEQLLVAVEPLDGAVEAAALLEDLDDADQLRQRPRAAALGDRQRQSLQPVVLEHDLADLFGHLGEQAVALFEFEPAFRHLAVERDLDVDLIVRAIDAGRIVDEVGVDAPALPAELDPGRLGDAEIGALADRLDAQVGGVDSDRVVGGVADLLLAFRLGLHIGADAAEPEEVDLGEQDGGDQGGGLDLSASMPSMKRTSGLSGIDFWLRGKMPPPFEISALS